MQSENICKKDFILEGTWWTGPERVVSTASPGGRGDWDRGFQISMICKLRLWWVPGSGGC